MEQAAVTARESNAGLSVTDCTTADRRTDGDGGCGTEAISLPAACGALAALDSGPTVATRAAQ